MFVHCCSKLLSPICRCSLAWKQDQERFHTYTHWPLINKSDQGPFPHIHATHTKTKARAHTHPALNHTHIPEHTLLDLDHSSRLSGSDLATRIFVHQICRPCDVSIASFRPVMTAPSWHSERTQEDLFPSAVFSFVFIG